MVLVCTSAKFSAAPKKLRKHLPLGTTCSIKQRLYFCYIPILVIIFISAKAYAGLHWHFGKQVHYKCMKWVMQLVVRQSQIDLCYQF